MIQRVDLHTHTNASDGTDTPSELVENARKAGLAAVAITDHDTLSGLAEGEEAAQRMGGIEFVRGVEVSTGTDQGEMHIVGLWVPKDCEPLETPLQSCARSVASATREFWKSWQRSAYTLTWMMSCTRPAAKAWAVRT